MVRRLNHRIGAEMDQWSACSRDRAERADRLMPEGWRVRSLTERLSREDRPAASEDTDRSGGAERLRDPS